MKSLNFAFPFLPLAAALILGACGAPPAPPVTPAATQTPAATASTPASVAPSMAPSASATPAATPTPGGTKIPFEKLMYDGGAAEEGKPLPVTDNRRLKTRAELDALLDAVKAPKEGRPTVDFAKKEVLAFYDAGGPNGCYELALLELLNKGAVIEPKFAEKPQAGKEDPDRVCTMVLVLPHYLLVAIDRSPLPVAGIDAK